MVSIERAPTLLCVCTLPWSLFALPFCLQPSKKSVGGIFDYISVNYPAKSEFLGSIEVAGWANLFCTSGYVLCSSSCLGKQNPKKPSHLAMPAIAAVETTPARPPPPSSNKSSRLRQPYQTVVTEASALPQVASHISHFFSCPLCENQFTSKSTALRHMKSVHGNIRYACQICKKTFNRKDILKQHIMGSHEMNSEVARAMVECDSTKNTLMNE